MQHPKLMSTLIHITKTYIHLHRYFGWMFGGRPHYITYTLDLLPVFVSLSVCWHNSKTTRPNFTKFIMHVACGRGLVVLWRRFCGWRHLFLSWGQWARTKHNVMFRRSSAGGNISWTLRQPQCLVKFIRMWCRKRSLLSMIYLLLHVLIATLYGDVIVFLFFCALTLLVR